MTNTDLIGKLRLAALTLIMAAVVSVPSFAQNLVALNATAMMPDGTSIPMWGLFADTGQTCTTVPSALQWQVGPSLTAVAGGTLSVTVRNCLNKEISLFIPGQYKTTSPVMFNDSQGRQRARSFDFETPPNTSRTYVWTNLKAGTYLYHSGTHPQVQVQMGLYGPLLVSGAAYPPVVDEKVLVYSEIDPVLHNAVANGTYGAAPAPTSTFDYYPQYFLINGKSFPETLPISVSLSQNVLLRFVNAGLKTRVPTIQGLYMTLIAEDGNLYPFSREQYSTELPAAKTIDAILNAGTAGTYALYDRALGLTNSTATGGGMLAYIQAGVVAGAPTASNDGPYVVAEDAVLNLAAPGVLSNDTDTVIPNVLSATLVNPATAGTVVLNGDGSFTYTPASNFNGSDSFGYKATDGANQSNLATVSVSVTPVPDAPSAVNDAYSVITGQTLNTPAPGVLNNDTDADGDFLTAVISGTSPAGLVLNANGSFSYGPAGAAGSVVSFQYVANDGSANSAPATVTITVTPAPANVAPTANNDNWQTARNTPISLSVTANDVDPDGTINVATVDLNPATPSVRETTVTTQMGGTATVNNLGVVTFTPKKGYRGTDTFTYTVKDNAGATSNTATVRVNVR